MKKITKKTTLAQFENNYWYVKELKAFAREIGILSASKLRKDELEKIIKKFFKTGEVTTILKRNTEKSKVKDTESDLSMNLSIVNYINNKKTKDFILKKALEIDPELPKKTGCKYWLNRWREEQIKKGNKITYGDLVREYVSLRQSKEKFPQIPSTKFNNFISDYLVNKEGTKKQALKEWKKLRGLKIPKTYSSWKKYKVKQSV